MAAPILRRPNPPPRSDSPVSAMENEINTLRRQTSTLQRDNNDLLQSIVVLKNGIQTSEQLQIDLMFAPFVDMPLVVSFCTKDAHRVSFDAFATPRRTKDDDGGSSHIFLEISRMKTSHRHNITAFDLKKYAGSTTLSPSNASITIIDDHKDDEDEDEDSTTILTLFNNVIVFNFIAASLTPSRRVSPQTQPQHREMQNGNDTNEDDDEKEVPPPLPLL